jgi:hypothetical protein
MTISFHGTLLFWSGAIMPVDRFMYPLLFLPHNDVVDFAGSVESQESMGNGHQRFSGEINLIGCGSAHKGRKLVASAL